ncbi:molybdopterin-binding protein [Halomicroarcula sp. S1AR25-4]|uniref:molybdopterin-binding protein n=1 Tax=Haloarcula sp. S1AR25-4 TaxID=2950538 RepID=UPI002874C51F|nr:molybdopterin-binding protein [Halomicroarcula sp. S1AR25-4]MDS0278363.1 molybdopterin-binding protein [Halomicroarcula sp. S1AR25-4]
MVDFQSRDTRRASSDDGDETDDEDDAERDETAADQSGDGTTDGERTATDSTTTAETAVESDEATEQTDADHPTADAAESSAADPLGDRGSTGAVESDSAAATESTAETQSRPAGHDDSTDSSATADTAQSAERHPAGGAAGSKVASGNPSTAADRPSQTPAVRPVEVALVTVGTTTGQGEDPTGEALTTALESAGHTVTARERLRGDYDGIQQAVDNLVGRDDVEAVVTAGGVGISASEVTVEAVHPLFEKALPGFGEAFRTLLFEHIGTGIVAVRATAGITAATPVFCLPADAEAATLAVDEIIAAEAPELVDHLQE